MLYGYSEVCKFDKKCSQGLITFIICLPGLFALDVCASIHLYASNASATLYSVLFSVIVVETMEERAVSVKQIHWGLHVAKKCGQGLKGALFSVFLACLR